LIATFGFVLMFIETKITGEMGGFMVFKDTFNNISVISWNSVLLVEETRVPRENRQPAASH
jgi:hypothetical protein